MPGTQTVTLVNAVLVALPTGPPSTVAAATFGPAPDGKTVICKLVFAAGLATDVAVTVAVTLPVTALGAT